MQKSNLFTILSTIIITLFLITGLAIAEDALYIDENGYVGLGTESPNDLLHIYKDYVGQIGLRIENPHSVSNGGVQIALSRGAAHRPAQIKFQNVTTDEWYIGELYNSGGSNTKFSIATGNTLSDSKIIVQSDGYVGIGTTSPNYRLDVSGNIGLTGTVSAGYTGSYAQTRLTQWGLTSTGSMYIEPGPGGRLNIVPTDWSQDLITGIYGKVGIGTASPGSYKLYVAGSAYSTGGWLGSDKRWKENIKPLENSLEKISQLQGVSYDWKIDEYPELGFTEGSQVGLIAQDVEKIIPELVHTDDNGYKAISYEKLTPVLVEAFKELKAENDNLVEMIAKLEDRIAKLEQGK